MAKSLIATTTGVAIVEGSNSGLLANPMTDPAKVLFHHTFGYYGVVAQDLARVVNHGALAGSTEDLGGVTVLGQAASTTHHLLTHGLGYAPKYFVALNGVMLPQGVPVQLEGDRARWVSAYATTTEIRLWELAISSDVALSATSLTYAVVAFRDSVADPALPMLKIQPGSMIAFGQGKFRIDAAHLRITGAGEPDFSIPLGRTADISGGGVRVVPPSAAAVTIGPYDGAFGGSSYLDLSI